VKPGSSGMGTRISIRGGGGSGAVLVLIDGRPVSAMQYGGVDLGSIPIDIVKKITVFKPPVPVWLGPGSSAGAIYIETKYNTMGKKVLKKGQVRVSAGSYGQANISSTCQIDSYNSDFMISGGVGHNDGKQDNSQKDQGYLGLHYGKKADLLNFQVNAKAFVSDHGVAGPTYNPTPNSGQRYEKASLDLKLDGISLDILDYDVKAYLDVKKLKETANNGDTAQLDAVATGLRSDFFLTPGNEKNELRFGTLIEYSQADHTLTGIHDRTLFSFNGVYNMKVDSFRLITGLRSDYTSDFYYSPGAHMGLSYKVMPQTVLKANAGYSENTPSFGQLYQPSHGSMDQVRGNPYLEKEEIISYTLGGSHSFETGHQLEINLFMTETRDLIKYQRGIDLINRPENISKAVKMGVETSLKFYLTTATDLDLNYIWQDTENKDNGKELSYAPEHTAKVTLKTKFHTGTKLELTTTGYTDQYTDNLNTGSQKLKEYITTDAKIIHPIELCNKKAEFFAHVHNLFDTDFQSHYGYPDDGFKLQCGITINY
ncbi:MAG: TonB-dependent receptor, partial [Proteobacteria bacterium]|nr:TonB-dependent receptor [Pseudomonadota bacterium]